jgi:hypothetical protein
MTKNDRQKLSLLIVLLAVLGLTLVLGFRVNQPPAAAAPQTTEQKTSSNPPTPNDARIRLDLVENPPDSADVGKKNVFQYYQPPPPAPPTRPGPSPNATPPVPVVSTPTPTRPSQPPPISLKYQGFAATSPAGGGLTAFLADDSRHYNVTTGEVLMGRYRILGISDKSVEVEDLELNRRQTLPLLK